MIHVRQAKLYCREDITNIENYQEAINDTTQTWVCHHRDEIKTLPSGIKVIRDIQYLIENDRYYNCPANELIFMRRSEHVRLHNLNKSIETRRKISESLTGHSLSEEAREKIRLARTGTHPSDETRRKLSMSHKGLTNAKGHIPWNKGLTKRQMEMRK